MTVEKNGVDTELRIQENYLQGNGMQGQTIFGWKRDITSFLNGSRFKNLLHGLPSNGKLSTNPLPWLGKIPVAVEMKTGRNLESLSFVASDCILILCC